MRLRNIVVHEVERRVREEREEYAVFREREGRHHVGIRV
jgi:hypothetical protein